MSGALDWSIEGRDWPLRETSRIVQTQGLKWRVQVIGDGPDLLLLHGTGASAHSWHGMIAPLAEQFRVIAPDLPGHAFTRGRPARGPTLPAMAEAVSALLAELEAEPVLVVGHSAGAAIALQWALATGSGVPIVGLSPAVMPFAGAAARLFPTMAKLLFVNPFVPRLFSRMARVPGETERFLKRATQSRIDRTSLRCYEHLLGNSRHCEGALEMMANWDLDGLKRTLSNIPNRVLLVHGEDDNAVPMTSVHEAAALLPNAQVKTLKGLGHLAHEEDPATVLALIAAFAGSREGAER